jgi:hypothetical protein
LSLGAALCFAGLELVHTDLVVATAGMFPQSCVSPSTA